MSDELKAMISEGQRQRYVRQQLELGPRPVSGIKRCSSCGATKSWDIELREESEFPIRTRKNVSGEQVLYPAGECKRCNAARAAAHRQKLRDEGTLSDKQKEWNANRDPEHRKRYQREYGRIQRALAGATPRGPWKRYKHELDAKRIPVPKGPFLEWLDEWLAATGVPLAAVIRRTAKVMNQDTDVVERRLNRVRAETKTVDLLFVDAIAVAMGMPHVIRLLYP